MHREIAVGAHLVDLCDVMLLLGGYRLLLSMAYQVF